MHKLCLAIFLLLMVYLEMLLLFLALVEHLHFRTDTDIAASAPLFIVWVVTINVNYVAQLLLSLDGRVNLLELVLRHNILLAHAVPAHETEIAPSFARIHIMAAHWLSHPYLSLLHNTTFLGGSIVATPLPQYGVVTTLRPRQYRFLTELVVERR